MYFTNSVLTLTLAGVIVAVGYSGVIATTDLLVARMLDEDARVHGVHREAIFTSAFGFMKRLSTLIKAGTVAAMALVFGYVSGAEPGDHPDSAARLMMIGTPLILGVVAVVVSRFVAFPKWHDGEAQTDPMR